MTADQYPYIASSTKLAAMVVPHWALQGTTADFVRLAADPEARQSPATGNPAEAGRARRRQLRSGSRATHPRPDWAGLDLATIAGREGTTPLEVVLEIQRHGGAQAISFGMSEDDVREVMRHDFVATASDGSTHVPGPGEATHPRAYGTFPRKIRYALDDKVMSLEQAIRSCSGLPAEILGLPDRGIIRARCHRRHRRLRPGDIPRCGDVRPADLVRPRREAPVRQRPGADRRRRASGGAELESQASRPGAAAATGRPGRVDRQGQADLDRRRGQPWAEALAVRDGAIAAVGTFAEVERFRGPATRVIDRPDAFAIPGLIDAHGHMESLGATQEQLDLRGVASLEEVARRVKELLDRRRPDSWITGRNWDQSLWPGGAFPTAAVLDQAVPGRPVWLKRVDGHAGWANSEAMRLAKVEKDTQAPPTARSSATRTASRPASSSTAPWAWSAAPCPRRARTTSSAGCSPPRSSCWSKA